VADLEQPAPDLDDIAGQQLALVGDVLLHRRHAAAGLAQIGRRQPEPREEIPVGLVEFPDIPHDVHVADVIALPRIDRAAIGRLCHRPLLLRFLPYILDTVPYQKRAGNTSPYQESVRILSESKSVKQGCSLRRKSPISCWEKADAARPGRPGRIMISRSRRPLQV